ncbi:MAG: DNA methyltransferase [Halobacteriaceae archaeon]
MSEETAVTEILDSVPAYQTGQGAAYLGDSRDLLSELPESSIDLVVTSPPFALQHQKEYGNESLDDYNDWFMEFAEGVQRALQPHGSFIIEIGDAFERGSPRRSTYQFELISRLTDPDEVAQDFYWFNPAKLPKQIEWVNVRKIRATDSMTHIWWLAKDINKDPAYTAELKQKVKYCDLAVNELRKEITDENLLAIVEAILRGEINGSDEAADYYPEEIRELIASELPNHAASIDSLIKNSEKAPKVFVRDVLETVRDGQAIPEPSPRPEANNQRVLQEYSDSQKNLIETGEYNSGKRPSGWDIDPDSFATDNEGAIPKKSHQGVQYRLQHSLFGDVPEIRSGFAPRTVPAGDSEILYPVFNSESSIR